MTERRSLVHARPWTPRVHPDNPFSPTWRPLEERSEMNRVRWWAARDDENARPRLQDMGRAEVDIDVPVW